MQPRIDVMKHLGSGVGRAMLALSRETQKLMDPKLFHLIEIRASQLNGCAYCIDMHTKDARLAGETEQRIYGLSAWHETPFYTPRTRRAGIHGSRDAGWRHARARRALRPRVEAVRRGRDAGADLRGGGDQRLESAVDFVPHGAGDVSAGAEQTVAV